MDTPSSAEQAVLDAARRYFHEVFAGRNKAEAMVLLVAATTQLPIHSIGVWESKLRALRWSGGQQAEEEWKASLRHARWVIGCTPHVPPPFAGPTLDPWIELSSYDGYARETALRSFPDGAPSAFFCALALRRLNDWVPEVRAAARERLPTLIERTNPADAIKALWGTLLHWDSWGRLDDSERQTLLALIGSAQERIALGFRHRIIEAAAGGVASLLTEICRAPDFDAWLPEIARSAVQPAVRAKAYRFLLEGRVVWRSGRKWVWTDRRYNQGYSKPAFAERPLVIDEAVSIPSLVTHAAADRSSLVRLVAGQGLVRHLEAVGPQARALAETLAADPAPAVAEWGRFALARLDGTA